MQQKYIRLSHYLGVTKIEVAEKGVYDRVIGNDSELFFDPFLLPKVDAPEFNGARDKILKHFSKPIKLIKAGYFKQAADCFNFKEVKGVGLGYGQGTENGSAIGPKLASNLVSTAKELIDIGMDDPEIIELIGLFQEGFGADRLSDISISILQDEILAYTARITQELTFKKGVTRTFNRSNGDKITLPIANGRAILFLPKKALRNLPTADERDNIDSIINVNKEVRAKFNELLGDEIYKWSKLDALNVFKEDPEAVRQLVDRYKTRNSDPYDVDLDDYGFDRWVDDGIEFARSNPLVIESKTTTLVEVQEVVIKIIKKFKQGIEFNGWNKLLFDDRTFTKPRHENYAQLVFFIVAQNYCEVNDLDLSPECNSGRGPIDFKISRGMSKVVVELKLTSNKSFIHGIKTQLPIYQVAENAPVGIFLAVKTTKSNNQIENLQTLEIEEKKQSRTFPQYFVVDAFKKPSASKAR